MRVQREKVSCFFSFGGETKRVFVAFVSFFFFRRGEGVVYVVTTFCSAFFMWSKVCNVVNVIVGNNCNYSRRC